MPFKQQNFKCVSKFYICGGQKNGFQQSLIFHNFKIWIQQLWKTFGTPITNSWNKQLFSLISWLTIYFIMSLVVTNAKIIYFEYMQIQNLLLNLWTTLLVSLKTFLIPLQSMSLFVRYCCIAHWLFVPFMETSRVSGNTNLWVF